MKTRSIAFTTIITLTAIIFYGIQSASVNSETNSTPLEIVSIGESFAATSLTEKAPYDGPINVPDPAVSRQGGEDISTAFFFDHTDLPYSNSGTTVGYADDYDEICPYDTPGSPDVVYGMIWGGGDTLITISLCFDATDYDTKIYVYDFNDTTVAIACNDDFCTTNLGQQYVSQIDCLPVLEGTVYYIVIDGYDGEAGNYELSVDYCIPPEPCFISCPAGAIPEGEPCGTDINGGCNSAIPVFSPINAGDTICGNAWADGTTRDTDWYTFTLADTATVTLTGCADFPFILGFIDTADCDLLVGISPNAQGNPCDTITTSLLAGPGEYWVFAANQLFSNVNPCGTENLYWFTIEFDCTAETWYADTDNDTYGDIADIVIECDQPDGYVSNSTDCDDTDPTIYPGAPEIANDGIDQDCDGEDLVENCRIYVDHVVGLNPDSTVNAGSPVRFVFRLINSCGRGDVTGFTNGFEIWTENAGLTSNYSPVSYGFDSSTTCWSCMFDGISENSFSADGIGIDTVSFSGFSLFSSGFPDGFDEIVWWIETTPTTPGDLLCIDSAFFPPGGAWIWSSSSGNILPSPPTIGCLLVVECCVIPGDFDGNGGVDIADLTTTVNWMFKGGAPADCANDADVDASCDIDVADLTYRVNFMFKGGPAMDCGCVE